MPPVALKKVLFVSLFFSVLSINTWAGRIHLQFADGSTIWMSETLLRSDLNVDKRGLLGRLLEAQAPPSDENKEAEEKSIRIDANGKLFLKYVADILKRGQGIYFSDTNTAKNVLELCKELGLPKAQKYVEDYLKVSALNKKFELEFDPAFPEDSLLQSRAELPKRLPKIAAQLLQAFHLDNEKELESIVSLNELNINTLLIPFQRGLKGREIEDLKLNPRFAIIDGTKGSALLHISIWGKKKKWVKRLIEMGARVDQCRIDYGPESSLTGNPDLEKCAELLSTPEILQMIVEAKKSRIAVPMSQSVMASPALESPDLRSVQHLESLLILLDTRPETVPEIIREELKGLKLEVKNQLEVCSDLSAKKQEESVQLADLNREIERLLSLKNSCETSLLNSEQALSELQQKCLASQQELQQKEELIRSALDRVRSESSQGILEIAEVEGLGFLKDQKAQTTLRSAIKSFVSELVALNGGEESGLRGVLPNFKITPSILSVEKKKHRFLSSEYEFSIQLQIEANSPTFRKQQRIVSQGFVSDKSGNLKEGKSKHPRTDLTQKTSQWISSLRGEAVRFEASHTNVYPNLELGPTSSLPAVSRISRPMSPSAPPFEQETELSLRLSPQMSIETGKQASRPNRGKSDLRVPLLTL